MSHDAREFLSKSAGFVKKDELRQAGPLLFAIASTEVVPAKDWGDGNGKPAASELVVVSTEGRRFCVSRTQDTLKRVLAGLGDDWDKWAGRILELYYSPDVRNPRNSSDPGGIRVRILDPAEEVRARAVLAARVAVPVPEVPKDVIPF